MPFKRNNSVKWCWLHFQTQLAIAMLLLLSLVCFFYLAPHWLDSGSFIHFITQCKPRPLTTTSVVSHPSDESFVAFCHSKSCPLQFLVGPGGSFLKKIYSVSKKRDSECLKIQHKVISWSLPKMRDGFDFLGQKREEHLGPSSPGKKP